MTDEQVTQNKQSNVGLIASWVFGLILALSGLTSLFSQPIPAIIMLFMAATLLPPVNKLVSEKFKFQISTGIKTSIIIIGLALIGMTIKEKESPLNDIQPSNNQQAIQTEERIETEPVTVSQINAIRKANEYLDIEGFSKIGLIKQLKFEGFPEADSTYAVDNINVDWNAQARRKGQSYLDISAFSRSGLITQLKFEGFTNEQATYAANQLGL